MDLNLCWIANKGHSLANWKGEMKEHETHVSRNVRSPTRTLDLEGQTQTLKWSVQPSKQATWGTYVLPVSREVFVIPHANLYYSQMYFWLLLVGNGTPWSTSISTAWFDEPLGGYVCILIFNMGCKTLLNRRNWINHITKKFMPTIKLEKNKIKVNIYRCPISFLMKNEYPSVRLII